MPYPYDLPIRLPIADKMEIGERSYEEIDWLLEHGEIRSSLLWRYHKILRPVPGVYQLWKGMNQDDPEESEEEEIVETTLSLKTMVQSPEGIQYWYWLPTNPYDSFLYIRQFYHLPFLKKYLAIECGGEPGVISGADGGYILVYTPGAEYLKRYHPTWDIVYYDGEGNILADYREKKEEEKADAQ